MSNKDRLKLFLQEYYIDNPRMNSGNMKIAIRDLLTDLLYVGNEMDVTIQSSLMDAEEVYDEEVLSLMAKLVTIVMHKSLDK